MVGSGVMTRIKGRGRVRVSLVVWSRDIPPTRDAGVPRRFADSRALPGFGFAWAKMPVAPMDLHLG